MISGLEFCIIHRCNNLKKKKAFIFLIFEKSEHESKYLPSESLNIDYKFFNFGILIVVVSVHFMAGNLRKI